MAKIVYPKIWAPEEILTASDLNNEFAAISPIVNGQLANENIAGGAGIVGSKIASAPNGIDTAQINNGAVTKDKILNGAVVAGKLGSEAVDSSNIKDLTIQTGDIKDKQITTEKIAFFASISAVGGGHRAGTPGSPVAMLLQAGSTPLNGFVTGSITPRNIYVRVSGSVGGAVQVPAGAGDCFLRLQLVLNGVSVSEPQTYMNGGPAGVAVPWSIGFDFYQGHTANVVNNWQLNLYQPGPVYTKASITYAYLSVEEPA